MTRLAALLASLVVLFGVWTPLASAEPTSTTWLCRPGESGPCGGGSDKPVDCFYVYPTASLQQSVNADRSPSPELAAVAALQARPFDDVCNVWAPTYRQLTLRSLATLDGPSRDAALALAYTDIRAAWADFLANRGDDRPVVLVGHSQGTRMLRNLLQDIETTPARDRLVSALLIGATITPDDFRTVAPCSAPGDTGCFVAYSTYNRPRPADARYGGPTAVCTNPAALGSTAPAPLRGPIPDVSARCDADNVLHVEGGVTGALPTVPDATWGLHLLDITLAQDSLVDLVRTQSAAFLGR
ncbi:DUF3089 domain-containing protein [Rhodococcoides corynebacterioides]|uniref:DUF3089 domain-containing protein n=1 Tax=Rhodococcoides corynebacterioides TaxID=53972 RepID=UPI003F7CDFB7